MLPVLTRSSKKSLSKTWQQTIGKLLILSDTRQQCYLPGVVSQIHHMSILLFPVSTWLEPQPNSAQLTSMSPISRSVKYVQWGTVHSGCFCFFSLLSITQQLFLCSCSMNVKSMCVSLPHRRPSFMWEPCFQQWNTSLTEWSVCRAYASQQRRKQGLEYKSSKSLQQLSPTSPTIWIYNPEGVCHLCVNVCVVVCVSVTTVYKSRKSQHGVCAYVCVPLLWEVNCVNVSF